MKTSRCLLIGILLSVVPAASIKAQCSGAITPTVITYDSTVVGVGRAPYQFTFPKFNPALGTLTSVRVQSVVSIQYNFTLENLDYSPKTLRHRFYRYDDITSAAASFSHSGEFESPNYSFSMVPSHDGIVGSGPDVVSSGPLAVISGDTLVNRVVFNTAAFMGPGDIAFNYATDGDVNLTSSTGYFGSTTDVVTFNISYVYCPATALIPNTINLNVQNAGPLSALIKWEPSNESQAQYYEVMVSEDGEQFSTTTIVQSKGNAGEKQSTYQYKYKLRSPAQLLYFRIKQVNKDNRLELSAIKKVNWRSREDAVYFIADPSGSSINAYLPGLGGGSWSVDLFAANGQLLQRNQVQPNTNGTIAIKQKLQHGVYIIRAVNNSKKELITRKLFIR
ncbi:choice-of-anchor E domain-containing protein [Flavitalea antarctica]